MRRQPARKRALSGSLQVYKAIIIAAILSSTVSGRAIGQSGEEIFQGTCKACHTIGGGRVVGPDLAGVTDRRSEAWILAFVKHSQSVIASGDSQAVALAAEYPGLSMPDWPLSDKEIRAVLAYIKQVEAAGPASGKDAGAAVPAGDPNLGRRLFQGTTRFANGGPSCNSCHDVSYGDVIGGGGLAKDLTTVFSRLGGPGVRAIVGSPPFPVMQRAFQDRPLTDQEVGALVAFLEQADANKDLHQPLDYGIGLFVAGLAGAMLLLGLYSIVWKRRKRGPVNREIYARQVRSS